jgi:hypothetical protein
MQRTPLKINSTTNKGVIVCFLYVCEVLPSKSAKKGVFEGFLKMPPQMVKNNLSD